MRMIISRRYEIRQGGTAGRWRAVGPALLLGLGLLASGPSLEAAVLEVRPVAEGVMAAGTAEKAQAVSGVSQVERYLLVRTQPHDVIGIEAEAPLRIVTGEGKVVEARVEAGKAFRKADEGKNVVIAGGVYAEDYGFRGGGTGPMATMKHPLEVGQSFKFTEDGPRMRVVGLATTRPEGGKLFLPLGTAQRLFQREGKVSHLFVTIGGDAEAAAKRLQQALGAEVRISVISP